MENSFMSRKDHGGYDPEYLKDVFKEMNERINKDDFIKQWNILLDLLISENNFHLIKFQINKINDDFIKEKKVKFIVEV